LAKNLKPEISAALQEMIHIHPTLAEAINSAGLAT
jgi:pyruvate/2-oxoglutarate dehydrogenase complex dihydrolipoamide dehydrogenase (E3) component